jgi:flagellin
MEESIMSLRTYGTLSSTSNKLEKSIGKLSSGLRITGAADDAAGLAMSEKMRRQVRGLSRAKLNAQDGISMVQTAEGALNETHSILQRMRELASQSANDTLTSNDRLEIQKEVVQLRNDLDRISNSTEFNTKKLLDGSQTALISSSSKAVEAIVNGSDFYGNGDYDVEMELLSGGISQMQRSQIFTVNDGSGSLADGGTQLQSISQFYDENGVFVLGTPQTLTIRGNGQDKSISIDGQMSLDNLAAELQNALVSDNGLDIDNSKAAVVGTVQTSIAGDGGYLQLASGFVGEQGRFSFAADEKLVTALGFSVSREAVSSQVELSARDGYGNLTTVRVDGNVASGLLDGVDLHFASQSAQVAGTKGLETGLEISSDQTFTISVNGDILAATISADGTYGRTMEGIARSLNDQIVSAIGAGATGLKGLAASVNDGEIRLTYEKPASASATVANTIVIANATGNADVIGLVDGSYSGFVDAQKDKNYSVQGFSRYVSTDTYGIASGTALQMDISDGNVPQTIDLMTTIGSVSGTVADMVLFDTFQANINADLEGADVAIRVDQVGAAMAFTSLRVGTEHLDNDAANTSMVTLANFTAGSHTALRDKFGLTEQTAKGSGDTNFKIHVVDNQSQFQIGADQGQTMAINIANMSAAALGVDNIDMSTVKGANEAMGVIGKAIDRVSAERSKLGSYQNRLEYSVNNLNNMHSNMVAAESRIRDADIALEMIEFTKLQIMHQSGTAMLAQANAVPRGVLDLLGS